jgi:hypothetical protein
MAPLPGRSLLIQHPRRSLPNDMGIQCASKTKTIPILPFRQEPSNYIANPASSRFHVSRCGVLIWGCVHDFEGAGRWKAYGSACACLFAVVRCRTTICAIHTNKENGPTGFHLIMPLKRDISCSSVHGSGIGSSGMLWSVLAVVSPSGASTTVSVGVSTDSVEGALDDSRGFFLGGITRVLMASYWVRGNYARHRRGSVIRAWRKC